MRYFSAKCINRPTSCGGYFMLIAKSQTCADRSRSSIIIRSLFRAPTSYMYSRFRAGNKPSIMQSAISFLSTTHCQQYISSIEQNRGSALPRSAIRTSWFKYMCLSFKSHSVLYNFKSASVSSSSQDNAATLPTSRFLLDDIVEYAGSAFHSSHSAGSISCLSVGSFTQGQGTLFEIKKPISQILDDAASSVAPSAQRSIVRPVILSVQVKRYLGMVCSRLMSRIYYPPWMTLSVNHPATASITMPGTITKTPMRARLVSCFPFDFRSFEIADSTCVRMFDEFCIGGV